MENSSKPACLGIFGRAKLLRPARVGLVLPCGEVGLVGGGSSQPLSQCIEGRGKCKSSNAHEGRGEARGTKNDQGIEDYQANSKVLGQGEAERREDRCRRLFVEGREDAEEECSVEEGGVPEEGLAEHQPNPYEAERNIRVAKVQERLQLLLSAKSRMWVSSFYGFLFLVGSKYLLFPFARTGTMACGEWSSRTVPPARSPPNPKTVNLILPCATCFDTICWRTRR